MQQFSLLLINVLINQKTDITQHAITELERSKVQNVYIVGRRGPMQVSFTIKELRELTKIPDTQLLISKDDVSYLNDDIVVSVRL